MNGRKRLSFKFIAITSILMSSLFMAQPKNAVAKENSKKQTQQNVKNLGEWYTYYSEVSTNMLDINTSVIAKATVVNILGQDSKITATFDSLPQTGEKIIAVLTDENVGGVVQSKFLGEKNTVVFENIPDAVGMPGIHLYRQSSTDPDFVLRRENFIASTSYVLPRRLAGIFGPMGSVSEVHKKDGTIVSSIRPRPYYYYNYDGDDYFTNYGFYLWSVAIPNDFLSLIGAPEGTTFKDILAVIIPENYDGTPVNPKEPHKQCVASQYSILPSGLAPDELCRFEFSLPPGVENAGIHLYKNSLQDENLLCTFTVKDLVRRG